MARFPTEPPPATLPQPSSAALSANVRYIAQQLHFDDCRIAAAAPAQHRDAYLQYIAENRHGEMQWLAKNPNRRTDPRQVLDDCQSVIILAINYAPKDSDQDLHSPPAHPQHGARGRIARYARGEDYHRQVQAQLDEFTATLENWGSLNRAYVDTGPVLERNWASESGLGWGGKSTVQIHRRFGTWTFLASILTTLKLQPDPPARDRCGSCTRCIAACPTNAIIAPQKLDARRCISYLTIEHKGAIPEELRPAIGDRIFGCDDCLAACPWNRFAQTSQHLRLAARPHWQQLSLRQLLQLGEQNYRQLAAQSPLARTKWPQFARNLCVALGNVGNRDDLPALEHTHNHYAQTHPILSEHAHWAIQQIQSRHPNTGTQQ